MDFPPLKRHPALQPLSREHFNGLRQARQLTIAARHGAEARQDALELFLRAWRDEIQPHFEDEERLLQDLVEDADRQRLIEEHKELRRLVAQCEAQSPSPPSELIQTLGTRLADHIRWEERHLFQAVQQRATASQIDDIASQTEHIEAVRPGSRRRQPENPST